MDVLYNRRIDETVPVYVILPGLADIYVLQRSAINVADGAWLGASLS